MIGNPHKADLISCRLDTLELMKELAWKYKASGSYEEREALEEAIKELGVVSKEYTVMIDNADPMPEKWVKHYEVIEKFNLYGTNRNK